MTTSLIPVDPNRPTFRAFESMPTRVPIEGVKLHDFFGMIDPFRPAETDVGWVSGGYSKGSGIDGPEAFFIEAETRVEEAAHFHDVDQFQLFFGGSDSYFQRERITALMAQYADAFSTYGPFGSGEGGFRFYTLRGRPSGLRAYMPQERDKLIHRGVRQRRVDLEPLLRRPAAEVPTIETVWDEEPDGLAIYWIEIPPAQSVDAPPAHGAGQYQCVITGTIHVDGQRLLAQSLGWVPGCDEPISVRLSASDDTASKVLVLQLPRPTYPQGS
jgi:hypothetical protein